MHGNLTQRVSHSCPIPPPKYMKKTNLAILSLVAGLLSACSFSPLLFAENDEVHMEANRQPVQQAEADPNLS